MGVEGDIPPPRPSLPPVWAPLSNGWTGTPTPNLIVSGLFALVISSQHPWLLELETTWCALSHHGDP